MINFLVHEKSDSVGVATVDIKAGENAEGLFMDSQESLHECKIVSNIPLGHKIALKDLKVGDTVIKYGHDIGKVTADIRTAANTFTLRILEQRGGSNGYTENSRLSSRNGRVGVRNHVVILPLDDLSNAACEAVASNIKGTLALPHAYGRLQFGEDLELFFRNNYRDRLKPERGRSGSDWYRA